MKVSVQALGPLWYGLISLGGGGVAGVGAWQNAEIYTYVCFAIVVAVVVGIAVAGAAALGDAIARGHCLQFHVAI